MKFRIDPGELRHIISIEYCTYVKNEDNIKVPVWEKKLKTKAKILNVRGDEFIQAQGTGLKIEKTFYIRARKLVNITEDDRVIYSGIPYEIAYVNNVEELGRYIEIKCKRVK